MILFLFEIHLYHIQTNIIQPFHLPAQTKSAKWKAQLRVPIDIQANMQTFSKDSGT